MRPQVRFVLLLGLGVGLAAAAIAAPPAPQAEPAQAAPAVTVAHLRLGQSAFPLNGPWKFSVGDSPLDPATGKPLWAQPGFDDSKWEIVDLTPPEGSYQPVAGTSGYVPGWTTKGHAGYWGWAWYRIRVQLEGSASALSADGLALEGPDDFDDVFQVFANGSLLGGFGGFSGKTPVEYFSEPTLFRLPQPSRSPATPGSAGDAPTEVVAFRVWMGPEALVAQPDAGGLHNPPVLGDAETVAAIYQLRWLDLVQAYSHRAVQGVLFVFLAIFAFCLVLFDRTDRVYLWIGGTFLLIGIADGLTVVASWTQQISDTLTILLTICILSPLIDLAWVMVWWNWFGRQRPRWAAIAAMGLTLFAVVSEILGKELVIGLVPHPVAAGFETVALLVRALFFALTLGIVIHGIRRLGLEGWLVLPAVLLRGVGVFSQELATLHIRLNLRILGETLSLSEIATLLLLLALALLLLRRLLRSVKAQRELALDVKQAQEVQRVIVPEVRALHPGLAIESVYRPAREVGGDFFQIIAHPHDGSMLIVAGDVAGKGLRAGMLVALLVGAIRSTAEANPDPEFVLHALNRRLVGRGDAAATCLALRIAADGAVTLANAGHLPPYLNGEPVAMEGALPLGMIEGAECSVMRFALRQNDNLVLISDGIIEAMDAEGNLCGFEQTRKLLDADCSAAAIADAAQRFGQEDDISVISVLRTSTVEAL